MSRRKHARRSRWWVQLASVAAVAAMVGATFLILRGASRPPERDISAPRSPRPVTAHSFIPYADAAPLLNLDALASHAPAALRGPNTQGRAAAWDRWVAHHNAAIRARLHSGDEDSAVNFWLFGTTFTSRPRATARELSLLGSPMEMEELLIGRLDDLVSALAAPGSNERLQFVRRLLERRGIDLTTPAGQERARIFFVEARERAIAERARHKRALSEVAAANSEAATLSAYATLYRDRGLSSDTSLSAAFALDRTFAEMASAGRLAAGSVTRVAIVGPGLDFTDKAEGYDFYPVQTIQPFAIVDSLLRHGLARAGGPRVTTFDISPRVNQHLEAAHDRALRGTPYVLQLPLAVDDPAHTWSRDLVDYWQRIGSRVGDEVVPLAAPPGAGHVRMRAVRIRPDVVSVVTPIELNIVLERPAGPGFDERFDLVIATNILVYYGPFEQALALANIATLLRPGGLLLSNSVLSPQAPFEPTAAMVTKVFWDQQANGDTLFWYRRR